ncbi:Cytochrome b-c1 complex subunit 7 [Coemansia furcata]|nr:Cytochrome b-c1 complex subunit 7 [Coemansia furcata]
MLEAVARTLQANGAFRAICRLRYDDLLREETPIIQEAISRLNREEIDLRNYRHRRAFQLSLSHQELPSPQWTKPEDDVQYLQPLIEEVSQEYAERDAFNSMTSVRK